MSIILDRRVFSEIAAMLQKNAKEGVDVIELTTEICNTVEKSLENRVTMQPVMDTAPVQVTTAIPALVIEPEKQMPMTVRPIQNNDPLMQPTMKRRVTSFPLQPGVFPEN